MLARAGKTVPWVILKLNNVIIEDYQVINTSVLFTQLVLHSYAVISLAFDLRNYCCIFAQIACNKLCNKFVQ